MERFSLSAANRKEMPRSTTLKWDNFFSQLWTGNPTLHFSRESSNHRVCPSLRPSVCPSVNWSAGLSVLQARYEFIRAFLLFPSPEHATDVMQTSLLRIDLSLHPPPGNFKEKRNKFVLQFLKRFSPWKIMYFAATTKIETTQKRLFPFSAMEIWQTEKIAMFLNIVLKWSSGWGQYIQDSIVQ